MATNAGYKMATKILKLQRKTIFSENMITKNPENTPFVTQGSPNLIREGGRTVKADHVDAIEFAVWYGIGKYRRN